MNKLLIILFLLPITGIAQGKYSSAGKKYFKQATQAYAEGNTNEALQLFKDCVQEDPDFAEAHLNLATIYSHKKKYDLALIYARRAYFYNKYQPEVYTELGSAYLRNGMYDSSRVILKRAYTEFNVNSDELLVMLATSLNKTGYYDEAMEHLNTVLMRYPNNPAALNERATAYFHMEEYEKAELDFQQVLEFTNDKTPVYANLANLYVSSGNDEKAEEYMNKAIEGGTESDQIEMLILKGNFYRGQGKMDEASEAFEKAFALDNENPIVLNNQASILIDKEEYAAAWEKCDAALAINSEMMEAYFNRGIANEMLRKTTEACLDWEQAFILGSTVAEEYLNSPVCTE